MHWKNSLKEDVILRIELEMACDHMNWRFIDSIMDRLG